MNECAWVFVASNDGEQAKKDNADFVCTGSHDELTIQKAIDKCAEENKNLFLYDGKYFIEGFYDLGDGGPKTALRFPNLRREIRVCVETLRYSRSDGVRLFVTKETLDALPDAVIDANSNDVAKNPVDVMRTGWSEYGLGNGSSLRLENFLVFLSYNQKPIRCIDLRRCDRIDAKNITVLGYAEMKAGLGNPPAVPVEGCIGVTLTDGSNHSYSNFTNVGASGFYEGIQVSGEHVVLINCNAIMNYYGYTFGNYAINCGANHPITLINCMDERNVCLPLFNCCGDSDKQGNRLQGMQEVSMISFNIERFAAQTPGQKLKDCMREVHPGTWRGNIDFTAQPSWNHINEVDFQLWENDGSGSGFKTRNVAHKIVCDSQERLSYYPSLGQQIFDTTLNKMVVCVDPKNRKWVDFLGNEV
ncbi:MAG: hypothetical protein IJX06_02110 [Clostridia bacterium]|nr:hypothetical protein [Clostridia bacterium]